MFDGYTGEVMRRAPGAERSWISFADLLHRYAEIRKLIGNEPSTATLFSLINDAGRVTFALNKVVKFIVNGLEDSLHFFALPRLSSS